jgi:hypothetical protein
VKKPADPRVKLALARYYLEQQEKARLAGIPGGRGLSKGRPWSDFNAYLKTVTPHWQWDHPHLRIMQDTLAGVVRGDHRKVMFFIPPRHGKSEQNTIRFASYCLENDPYFRIILWTYNQTLAEKFSPGTRKITGQRVELSKDRKAAAEWETAQGECFARPASASASRAWVPTSS